MSHSVATVSQKQRRTSEMRTSRMFNAPDADVTFVSSDGVIFCIHSENLTKGAGVFPPQEKKPYRSEPVKLAEDAATLELLFQFVYPQRQPSLTHLPFPILESLAEAVEKYQVYSAMQLCKVYMKQAIRSHPAQVHEFALRHYYRDLIAESAPKKTIEAALEGILEWLPEIARTWIRNCNRHLVEGLLVSFLVSVWVPIYRTFRRSGIVRRTLGLSLAVLFLPVAFVFFLMTGFVLFYFLVFVPTIVFALFIYLTSS